MWLILACPRVRLPSTRVQVGEDEDLYMHNYETVFHDRKLLCNSLLFMSMSFLIQTTNNAVFFVFTIDMSSISRVENLVIYI